MLSTTRTAGSAYVGSITKVFLIDKILHTARISDSEHVGSVTKIFISLKSNQSTKDYDLNP